MTSPMFIMEIEQQRYCTYPEKEAGTPATKLLIEETVERLRETVQREVFDRYKVRVPVSALRIDVTHESDPARRMELAAVRCRVHPRDIKTAMDCEMISKYPMMVMDEHAPNHNSTSILQAMLNEVLPNWRDVYDRIREQQERDDPEPHYSIKPFYGKKFITTPPKSLTFGRAEDPAKWIIDDPLIREDSGKKDEPLCSYLRSHPASKIWERAGACEPNPMESVEVYAPHGLEGADQSIKGGGFKSPA